MAVMDILLKNGVDYFTQQDIAEILSIFNGGVQGQILEKKSNTDNDVEWIFNHGRNNRGYFACWFYCAIW